MEPKFKAKEIVQKKNQPESVGIVLDPNWDDQTETWSYKVQFGNTITALPESSLIHLEEIKSVWDKLRNSNVSGIEHFKNTLTFHKLKSPTARVAYAFSTARTLFFPHQFKPLLKFLDNGGRGILIADDVGLGKTIESGYILRELQARRNIERIVILVPARLGIKWKREMRQRFEEDFEIVKGSDLLRLAEQIESGKELPPFKWIVSYESARREHIRAALESAQPVIDLFISDEAHRLRNTETLQHKLGRLLCDLSDNSVFLTATPVQNSLDDLWNLLRLLSEDEFPDREIFMQQVAANRAILDCQRYLSERPPRFDEAIDKLSGFKTAQALGAPVSDNFFSSILERLQKGSHAREDIAELKADIAQLNILGHVISRTRKSEAMPDCARREAMWNPIDLSPPEQRIYDSVEELCRVGAGGTGSESWGFQMATMMAFRATASCIPAAIEYFKERLEAKKSELEQSFDYYFEAGELAGNFENRKENAKRAVSDWFGRKSLVLTELVEYWQAEGGIDTKFEKLINAVNDVWDEDLDNKAPKRKIVIFSFFRKTLEYLRRSLSERGIGLRMIHGLVSLEDREKAIDDFLTRDDVPVLLTSEVGGEGIDLQRASVLFNYDLPWNPMVVEQRIGRLDRIGQQADKIVIVNFVVSASIEQKILQRLLDKIGIFETTIGEIDPIIGDEIENLTRRALSGVLTAEQLEEEIEKEERAIANRTVEARHVEVEAGNLFTSDQSLLDEIKAMTGEKQIPTEQDLLAFLNRFLAERYPGCQISETAISKTVQVRFASNLGLDMERARPELGNDVPSFGRRIAAGPLSLTVSREVGYRHIHSDLIHINHPLVRFVINEMDGRFTNEAFCLGVNSSSVLDTGYYAFVISMLKMKGQNARNKMAIGFIELSSNRYWSDNSDTVTIVSEILEKGRSIGSAGFPDFDSKIVEDRLNKCIAHIRNEIDQRELSLAETRRDQRHAISVRLAEIKLQKARARLHSFIDSGAKPFAVKMGESKVSKAEDDLTSTLNLFEAPIQAGIDSWTEIAAGLLKVGGLHHD